MKDAKEQGRQKANSCEKLRIFLNLLNSRFLKRVTYWWTDRQTDKASYSRGSPSPGPWTAKNTAWGKPLETLATVTSGFPRVFLSHLLLQFFFIFAELPLLLVFRSVFVLIFRLEATLVFGVTHAVIFAPPSSGLTTDQQWISHRSATNRRRSIEENVSRPWQ